LPSEYESRGKDSEVDNRPTELVKAVMLPTTHKDRYQIVLA
jgi:hypothetical protein